MNEIKDNCGFCGREIVIKDKETITALQTIKGKDQGRKIYCSKACTEKSAKSIEGALDIFEVFS